VALGAFAHQQQVATFDGSAEIGNRHFVATSAAPDVGQQTLADIGGDGLPALAGGRVKSGSDSTVMAYSSGFSTCATGMRVQPALS
jgi:hypothetical protein